MSGAVWWVLGAGAVTGVGLLGVALYVRHQRSVSAELGGGAQPLGAAVVAGPNAQATFRARPDPQYVLKPPVKVPAGIGGLKLPAFAVQPQVIMGQGTAPTETTRGTVEVRAPGA